MREKTMLSSYLFTTEKGRYFTTIQESHVTSIGRIIKTVQVTCLEWFDDNAGIGSYYGTHVYSGSYDYSGDMSFCEKFVYILENRILGNRS